MGVVSTFFRWSVIGICESRHLTGSECRVCHLHRLHLIHRACCLVPNAAPAAYIGCIPRQARPCLVPNAGFAGSKGCIWNQTRRRVVPNAGFAGSKGCIPSTWRADWFHLQGVSSTQTASRAMRVPAWFRMQPLSPTRAASHPPGERIGFKCSLCRACG